MLYLFFYKDEISPLHFVSVEMTKSSVSQMPYLVTSSAVEKSHRIEQTVEISPFHCVSVEMT